MCLSLKIWSHLGNLVKPDQLLRVQFGWKFWSISVDLFVLGKCVYVIWAHSQILSNMFKPNLGTLTWRNCYIFALLFMLVVISEGKTDVDYIKSLEKVQRRATKLVPSLRERGVMRSWRNSICTHWKWEKREGTSSKPSRSSMVLKI